MQHYIERLLIVLNADGTLKGAAQYTLTVLDNGKAIQGDAEAVAPEALATILPNQAALTAQVTSLLAELDLVKAANLSMKEAVDRLAAERDDLARRYQAMTAARDVLLAPVAAPQEPAA